MQFGKLDKYKTAALGKNMKLYFMVFNYSLFVVLPV